MSEDARLPQPVWMITTFLGIGLTGLGALFCLLPLIFQVAFASLAVVTVGLGLIMLTLGLSLIVVGAQGWRGREPRPFYVRGAGWILALLSLGIGALGMVLPGHVQARVIFAPIHFAMITLPGLLLLVIVIVIVGRDHSITVRRMVLALAGGASSVLLAIPVELIGLLVSGMVGVGLVLLLPSGAAEIDRLWALVNQWSVTPPTQESDIMGVLASPVVLVTLGLTLGIVTPLVEEFGKTLVMGVMGIWVKPGKITAFLWGVTCGLGFAWFEGVTNGALALGEPLAWAGSVGMRFCATALHALTSGIIGLGWAAYWRRHRWGLLIAYAVAVFFHGLWNLNVVFSLAGTGLLGDTPALGTALMGLGVFIQGSLILLAFVGLFGIPALLRKRARG